MAIPIPRRRSSEVLGDFGKIRVEQHKLEGEPDSALPWFTLGLADWVVVAATTTDGRFVLVRQHRAGVNDLTIETAGGILDPGEDPEKAALRELREETGFEAERAQSLGWVHPNPAIQSNRCHLFLATGVTPASSWAPDENEFTEPLFMTETELRKALVSSQISHALAILALERSLSLLHERKAAQATSALPIAVPLREPSDLQRVIRLLDQMEETQRHKVLELARRILPGLTAEDIRNPHDFPDLADPDWHFEDGQLTGIQAVKFAMVSLRNDTEDPGEP